MFFLQHNFFNVSGVDYYVGTAGNDSNSCLQNDPCETLDKQILKSDASTTSDYTLYILDSTTLSLLFTVQSSQPTQPIPRLFTNYPQRNSTQSQIQINAGGQFRITGNAQFQYINFTMQEEVSNTEGGILNIQQNSPYRFLDIQFCNFIRCHALKGGAIYVSISTGAIVTVTNTTFVQCECVTESGYGGAIYADIIDDSRLELYNVIFDTCIAQSGGGLYANFSEGNLTFKGQCKFLDCQCTSGGVGCYLEILEFSCNITIIGEIEFERCISTVGSSAMVIYSRSTGYIHINQMSFRDCVGVNGAGGLYINAMLDSEITITGKVSINNCTNGWGSGGGFQCNLYGGFINITGELEFEECEGPSGSGFFILLENHAVAEINKALFKNCIAWEYGGGFAALIRDESQLIFKGVAQFIQCSCISEIYIPVGGGGIYSDINNGVLNIQDSIFDTCNCSQPGTGGAVSIIQGVNGKVFIKNASFTNCKTLLNSTNSLFGWGGALFLFTSVSSNALSSSNLLMTDLSFGGCESVIAGHNIHIRSVDTKATVLVISQNSLLTVNGIDDLYISPDYEVDYMGIDESNLNEGNNIPYNHLPLFASNAPIEAVKDYYIDADSSDTSQCEYDQNPCQLITYILELDVSQISDYIKGEDFIAINIQTSTSQEEQIQINSSTPLGNLIIIQSNGYQPNMNSYTKQSFLTSSNNKTLLTITDIGHLELYGLHFDNLISTSSAINSLISISSINNNQIPTLSIVDCEFKQNLTSKPIQYISHSIIDINGGNLVIKRTKLQNYLINNVKSLVMIRSDQINVGIFRNNSIQISNSQFENIQQIGFANGAVINALLKQGSQLKISKQTQFINCICGTIQGYRNIQLSGGAIYAVINGGSMQLNEIVMNQCKSESGGAVFANISNQGKLILNSQCQFYQCESYGNGGGIYVQMDFTTQSQFVINGAIFKQCRSFSSKISSNLKSGYGGGIFLTGTGDFNQQSELLDLRGMKIYQNSALNNGQSVFVVMANVVEWCQQGILGEYVKGNYSDLNSDVNELEGIAVSAETFESLTIEQIKIQQRSLEFYWTQQAIINSVQIIINVSKEQNPLQFTIQGDSMNGTQIKVKIIQLRNKTDEEINIEKEANKEIWEKYNSKKYNSNSQLNNINYKLDHEQQQINYISQIFINTSNQSHSLKTNQQELPRDKDGFIIWPPKNATKLPIVLNISSNNSQSIQFALKDFSWFDNRKKIYGILVSNTGKFFTDLDGQEDEAVQIEIQIEEGEQFYNFKTSYDQDSNSKFVFTWWIILLIALGGLILLIIIIIICCCICNRSKKKKEHIIYPVSEEKIRPN